jgi:hypothetical protein
MIRKLAVLSSALLAASLLPGCDDGPRCLSDGVRYDEIPEDAIVNSTCVAEGEAFDETYDCDKVEGPCTDRERGEPA